MTARSDPWHISSTTPPTVTPRVLMVSFFSAPLEGGAERQAMLLARALRARGTTVAYVAARLPGMPRYEELDGVSIYRLLCTPWWPFLRRVVATTVYQASLLQFLWSVKHRFDIFHCHGAFDVSAAPVVAMARRLGKVSLIKQASMTEFAYLKRAWGGSLMIPIVRDADAFVGNSTAVYDAMIHAAGLPVARCHCIPNGISLPPQEDRAAARTKLGLAAADFIVLNVASFAPGKNQLELIRLWPAVLKEHTDARLVLVGDGPLLKAARAEAQRLELGEHVIFAGRRADVHCFLIAADLFVFPSEREGMSNALMEAMAHGLPCIASDIPGNRALVASGRDGLLVPVGDHTCIAAAISALRGLPQEAARLGSAARAKIAAEFDIKSIAGRYLALYSQLMAQHRAKTGKPM